MRVQFLFELTLYRQLIVMQNGSRFKSSRTDILMEKLKLSKSPNTAAKPHKDSDLILRLDLLEEEFTAQESQLSKVFSEFDLELSKVEKLVSDEQVLNSKYKGKSSETVAKISEKMKKAITNHVKSRQQSDNYLLGSVEEGVSICKQAIAEEEQQHTNSIVSLQSTLQEDIPKIQGVIKKQKHEREGTHQEIEESTDKLIAEIEGDLKGVEMERTEIVESIKQMLEDLQRSTHEEMEEETASREQTEVSILMLIESMYDKIMGGS